MAHSELVATDDLDCSLVVDRLSQRLAGADEERYWSACACLWGRTFVEARTAWDRWPEQHDIGLKALGHALARATGHRGLDDPPAAVLEAIRERAVAEDDGSAEWGRALIFFEMAEWVLDGTSAQLCLTKAAQVYLEEIFRVIAVELAARMGRPISLADARQCVPADQRWHGAVAFLETI